MVNHITQNNIFTFDVITVIYCLITNIILLLNRLHDNILNHILHSRKPIILQLIVHVKHIIYEADCNFKQYSRQEVYIILLSIDNNTCIIKIVFVMQLTDLLYSRCRVYLIIVMNVEYI